MDMLGLLQICLFFLSGLYFYLLLPLGVYFGLVQLIREIKKKRK